MKARSLRVKIIEKKFSCFGTIRPILLTQETIINIVNSNGNKYVFNNSNSYDATKVYGLTTGTYTFKNIPQQHPIALLNNGKESFKKL